MQPSFVFSSISCSTVSRNRIIACEQRSNNNNNNSNKLNANSSKFEQTNPDISNKSFSDTDRQYISKVRDRLFAAATRSKLRSNTETNSNTNSTDDLESKVTASLPDDIDAMEDLMFNRAPVNANQVPLFGGWLDETAAGRKAGKQIPTTTVLDEEETPERMFTSAMSLFNRGLYRDASNLFGNATKSIGPATRLGGQYSLWYAQALDAVGDRAQAATILKQLQTHNDADVRKVARELHFIMTAPALELDPNSFLDIPPLDDSAGIRDYSQVLSGFKMGNKKVKRGKKPEPYSLEWYLEKERPPKMEDNTVVEAIVLAGLICCTLAFMIGHSSS